MDIKDQNHIKSNHQRSFLVQDPPTELRERKSVCPTGTCPCARFSSFERSTFDPQSANRKEWQLPVFLLLEAEAELKRFHIPRDETP